MKLADIIKNSTERAYFEGLLQKRSKKAKAISIHTQDSPSGVYPTAIAPLNIINELPWRSYESIKEEYSNSEKADVALWLRKMHGGIGSSIKRESYLKFFGRSSVGAKGTDLYIKTTNGDISIAEAQLVQAEKKTASFREVIFQDILNEDVVQFFDAIWKKVNPTEIKRFETLIQSNLPTINEQGQLTNERKAPAGHGYFGYEIINAIFNENLRPKERNLICCIGNGEDLSSTPDKATAKWMIDKDIPICMVTTTKTQNDMKGGQIALWDKGEEGVYLTIVEKAQAEAANQLNLFSEIGLRDKDASAFFNTNLVLLNIDVLVEKFKKANQTELLKASLPDLILNTKEQSGKQYTQLEGAMGSVYLNLDSYWRKTFNEPLVHIMNVSKENRTRFFSPIKSSFDFFMQFHSDRFSFNEETYHLNNNRPDALPRVNLSSKYSDLSTVLEAFKGKSIINEDLIDDSFIKDIK